jgi:hypothetical protein
MAFHFLCAFQEEILTKNLLMKSLAYLLLLLEAIQCKITERIFSQRLAVVYESH